VTASESVRVAPRDASWYDNPNVEWPRVYHAIISPPYVAACNRYVMLVAEAECAATANPGMNCRRRACLIRWQTSNEGVTEG
jgi:hypothetical protein